MKSEFKVVKKSKNKKVSTEKKSSRKSEVEEDFKEQTTVGGFEKEEKQCPQNPKKGAAFDLKPVTVFTLASLGVHLDKLQGTEASGHS